MEMATIRKRNGKYEAQVRRTGHPHISRTFIERRDAQQWARQMELAADRHDLPTTVDRKALGVTLGALVRRYRDTVVIHKRAGENERIALNAFALHPICRKTVSELRTSDFAAYRDERLKTVKPISLKRELSPLHHLFEIARDEWGIPIKENPITKLKFKATDQRRERRLKEGELDKLLAAAAKLRQVEMIAAIKLAVETGMRRGELLRMTWGDIDWSEPSLRIPLTKNGEARTIPLSSVAVSVLKARKPHMVGEGERVFQRSGNGLRIAFGRLRRRAGIEDLRWHDLRHEATSRLFEIGLTAPEVALITGHKSLVILGRYTHPQRKIIAAKFAAA
jgi:integrase